MPLADWHVFYFRDGDWRRAAAQAPGTEAGRMPDGVRLVLDLPAGEPVSGPLTVDWVNHRMARGQPS